MQSTAGTFTLKLSDQAILKELFMNFSKDNAMRFQDFFNFCLDKMLITNKDNFKTFLEAFNIIADETGKVEFNQFPQLMTMVAKKLIPGEKRPILTLLNDYLGDKTASIDNRIQKPRTIAPEDGNKRLIYPRFAEIYIQYERFFQNAFTAYYQTNYRNKRIFLVWRELSLQNKRISLYNFNQMLRDANIVPSLISDDNVCDLASKIAVPCTKLEQAFYSEKKINMLINEDRDPNGKTTIEGDPGLHYYEFLMLIGKIALEVFKDDNVKKQQESGDVFLDFVKNQLGFEMIERYLRPSGPKIDEALYENKFVFLMIDFIKEGKDNYDVKSIRPPTPEKVENEDEKRYKVIRATIQNRPDELEIEDTLQKLNKFIPSVPEPPEIIQDNPPPYKAKVVVIGQQVPVDKNANRNQKKPPKPARKNKDEVPIKYSDMPGPKPKSLADIQNDYEKELQKEKKLFKLNAGTLSSIEVDPIILKEILYPDNIPSQEVTMYLEAAINGQAEGRILFALKNLECASEEWDNQGGLQENERLFFEFMTASIYESACYDDLALKKYYELIEVSERLASESYADKSLPYMGLGSVLYHSNEYELSLRCFLKGLEIRKLYLGADHPDTGTCYNNIGCCYFKINRIKESYDHFTLAQLILLSELGPNHERTMVVKGNLSKSMKGTFDKTVPFRKLFQFYYNDKTSKVGTGGKKGKTKKKK